MPSWVYLIFAAALVLDLLLFVAALVLRSVVRRKRRESSEPPPAPVVPVVGPGWMIGSAAGWLVLEPGTEAGRRWTADRSEASRFADVGTALCESKLYAGGYLQSVPERSGDGGIGMGRR